MRCQFINLRVTKKRLLQKLYPHGLNYFLSRHSLGKLIRQSVMFLNIVPEIVDAVRSRCNFDAVLESKVIRIDVSLQI